MREPVSPHTRQWSSLTEDDLTDLSLLSFDCIVAFTITDEGRPTKPISPIFFLKIRKRSNGSPLNICP